ncbi:MAG: DUF4919 domain-containing protein [Ferruginibacter sp.]
MKKSIVSIVVLLITITCKGQSNPGIMIPAFKDEYTETIKKLESGITDIDYRNFRESFLNSEQFKVASKRSGEKDSLKKYMYTLMAKKNYTEIIHVTKQILSIDYTTMIAHKILRQTYNIIGDTANASKYKTIQFGLLNSIVQNGDGRTCATAWPVIKVEEEYFILQMIGATLQNQSIDDEGGICDKMQVRTEEGESKTYYFDIVKVMEGYKKLGIK